MAMLFSEHATRINWLKWLLYTALTSFILYEGRTLFIPLSYGILIAFVLYPFCKWLERRGMGKVLAISMGITLVVLFFLGMLFLLGVQFRSFLYEWPQVQQKLLGLIGELQMYVVKKFGIPEEKAASWFSELLDSTGKQSLTGLGTSVVSLVVNLFMLFIVPVFAFLILLYREQLMQVVFRLFPEGHSKKIEEVIRLSITTYYEFIKGMIVVYGIVGTLNSIGLLLLGIPHAIIFGFLTAIMTFIPYIGIIIASLLPITFAWITFNSVWYPVGVIAIFAFVQYLEANVIFPWAVSHRLKLNTLMTLICILLGGIIWGASGMILFVPFAAILKLIADRLEGWETISMLLGESAKPK
jgi:predicted PurR-regulated permease PerM